MYKQNNNECHVFWWFAKLFTWAKTMYKDTHNLWEHFDFWGYYFLVFSLHTIHPGWRLSWLAHKKGQSSIKFCVSACINWKQPVLLITASTPNFYLCKSATQLSLKSWSKCWCCDHNYKSWLWLLVNWGTWAVQRVGEQKERQIGESIWSQGSRDTCHLTASGSHNYCLKLQRVLKSKSGVS